ncbi:hypothetical protein GCM10027068_23320 [Prescottella soli]
MLREAGAAGLRTTVLREAGAAGLRTSMLPEAGATGLRTSMLPEAGATSLRTTRTLTTVATRTALTASVRQGRRTDRQRGDCRRGNHDAGLDLQSAYVRSSVLWHRYTTSSIGLRNNS